MSKLHIGKTVTVLALILSTCGILPKTPIVPLEENVLLECWESNRDNQKLFLVGLYRKLHANIGEN